MVDKEKSGSITISYGMPKSASTFAWMLLKDFLVATGRPVATLSRAAKGNRSLLDYSVSLDERRLSDMKIEVDRKAVVLKTHSAVKAFADYTQFFADSYVFVQHRDPRDIILSLIDHAARSRDKGIKDFIECVNVEKSFPTVDGAMRAFFSWANKPNAHLISYEQLCFNTHETILRLEKIYDAKVDIDKLMSNYNDKRVIRQFNKGVRSRWCDEMSTKHSEMVQERYSRYYNFIKDLGQSAA